MSNLSLELVKAGARDGHTLIVGGVRHSELAGKGEAPEGYTKMQLPIDGGHATIFAHSAHVVGNGGTISFDLFVAALRTRLALTLAGE